MNRLLLYILAAQKVHNSSIESSIIISFFLAIALLIAGAVSFFFPKFVWRRKLGWRAKDNEPSESVIETYKTLGVIGMIIGACSLVVAVILTIRYLITKF